MPTMGAKEAVVIHQFVCARQQLSLLQVMVLPSMLANVVAKFYNTQEIEWMVRRVLQREAESHDSGTYSARRVTTQKDQVVQEHAISLYLKCHDLASAWSRMEPVFGVGLPVSACVALRQCNKFRT